MALTMITPSLANVLGNIELDFTSWNEAGGLLGMIFAALFVLIGTFQWHLKTQDREHTDTVKTILGEEREERKRLSQEHRVTYDKLSDAITQLSKSILESRR